MALDFHPQSHFAFYRNSELQNIVVESMPTEVEGALKYDDRRKAGYVIFDTLYSVSRGPTSGYSKWKRGVSQRIFHARNRTSCPWSGIDMVAENNPSHLATPCEPRLALFDGPTGRQATDWCIGCRARGKYPSSSKLRTRPRDLHDVSHDWHRNAGAQPSGLTVRFVRTLCEQDYPLFRLYIVDFSINRRDAGCDKTALLKPSDRDRRAFIVLLDRCDQYRRFPRPRRWL